jgi:hypothetical protein
MKSLIGWVPVVVVKKPRYKIYTSPIAYFWVNIMKGGAN